MTKPRRRAMTPARKRRIWTKQLDDQGVARCGCGCGQPVDLQGPGVRYDHAIEWWIAPELDDDGPNVRAVRTECDKPKTYGPGGSISKVAKTKRQLAMAVEKPPTGERKAPKGKGRRLQGAGFRKDGPKRKIESRGFR